MSDHYEGMTHIQRMEWAFKSAGVPFERMHHGKFNEHEALHFVLDKAHASIYFCAFNGKRIEKPLDDMTERCSSCAGTGTKPEARRSGVGTYIRTCRKCAGTGQVLTKAKAA